MLTAEGCAARRQRLWRQLGETADAILITSPEHLTYLCGYAPTAFSFRTNESSAALLLTPGSATLIVDNVLRMFAEEAFVDTVELVTWYDGKHSAPPRRDNWIASVAQSIRALKPGRLAIELADPGGVVAILASEHQLPTLLPLGDALQQLRRVKDPDELATLQLSIRAAEAGFVEAMASIEPGITELELFHRVERACGEYLGSPARIYGDFAAGARAAGPNTTASMHALEPGELFVLDFSVVVQGYRGDFANTLVAGVPTPQQQSLFQDCLDALAAGEALLKPGAACRDIDAAVQGHLRARGWSSPKRSHTGHGLGLAHPEAPYLVAESGETLQPGDVVTLEPSMFPDTMTGGVRIEHNYLITSNGFERLSNHRLALTGS